MHQKCMHTTGQFMTLDLSYLFSAHGDGAVEVFAIVHVLAVQRTALQR